MVVTNEQVGDAVVVAAGPAQPTDVPCVNHLDRVGWEDHQTEFRGAVRSSPRSFAIVHDTVPQGPSAMQDAAAVSPAAGNSIATIDRERLPRRVDRTGDDGATSAKDREGDVRL